MNDGNVIDTFLKRMGFLANLAGILTLVLFGVLALLRIQSNLKLARQATAEMEYRYFTCRLYACCAGGYAFLLLFALFCSDWVATYWPTLCGSWTADGRIGQSDHLSAVLGDVVINLIACCLLHWLASTMGSSLIADDGTEIYIESKSEILKTRCAPVLAEIARLRAIAPVDRVRIAELERELLLHKDIWG